MPASRIPEPYAVRIAAVRADMQRRRLDGLLVWNRLDQIWLTGFTGEDGGVLLTPGRIVLLTDGRFAETAEREAPFARAVLRKVRGAEATAKEIRRLKIGRLGYDSGHLSVQTFGELRKHLGSAARLSPAAGIIGQLRLIKDSGEIASIRRAITVAQDCMQRLRGWLRPGMREREVAARLAMELQTAGAQEPAFRPIVAVGANASLPHYEPGDALVSRAEGVLIDWGARVDWYVSDLTRMVWPGSIPPQWVKAYEVVREAQARAIAAIRPGVRASRVDRAARSHIERSGFKGRFTHSVGHGIGLAVHESPGLRKTSDEVLKAGMVVTVEPGVYLPGKGGIRIEDDVLVTETGCEVLSSLPTERKAWCA